MLSQQYLNNPRMSQSRLKKILDGVEEYKYAIDNPKEPTDDMKLGQAVHILLLQPDLSSRIIKVHDKPDGRTKEGKIYTSIMSGSDLSQFEGNDYARLLYESFSDVIKNPSEYILLDQKSFDKAKEIANAVMINEDSRYLLQICAEFEKIYEYHYRGIDFKCQVDGISDEFVLDIKTSSTVQNLDISLSREILKYKYHFQAASYLIGTNRSRYFIIFVKTVEPYAVYPVELSAETLNAGCVLLDQACDLYNYCLKNNPEFKPNNRLRVI